MTFRRYTVEELHHLRQSPLVHKPDALPSIDQWMEYGPLLNILDQANINRGGKQAEQAAAQRRKTQPGRVEDTAQENALSRLPVNLRRGISRGQCPCSGFPYLIRVLTFICSRGYRPRSTQDGVYFQ
jgi:hypothetical protein